MPDNGLSEEKLKKAKEWQSRHSPGPSYEKEGINSKEAEMDVKRSEMADRGEQERSAHLAGKVRRAMLTDAKNKNFLVAQKKTVDRKQRAARRERTAKLAGRMNKRKSSSR